MALLPQHSQISGVFIGTTNGAELQEGKHQVDRLPVIQSLTIYTYIYILYIYIQVKWSSSIITDALNLISFPCHSREVKDIGAFVFLGELAVFNQPGTGVTVQTRS